MSYVEELVNAAQKLGSLSASAIFALICLVQGYIIYRKEKWTEDSNEKWRLTREGQIRADESQTAVMSKLVDVIEMNTSATNANATRIDRLTTILDERIPRGGGHA